MVFTPRFCWCTEGAVKAVREVAAMTGLTATADTKDLVCTEAGVVIFCLDAVRRVLTRVLEAIFKKMIEWRVCVLQKEQKSNVAGGCSISTSSRSW